MGCRRFVHQKSALGLKIICHPQGRRDTFGYENGKKACSSCLHIAAVIHFLLDLSLVKVEYSVRSQVLTRALQGTDYLVRRVDVARLECQSVHSIVYSNHRLVCVCLNLDKPKFIMVGQRH